MTQNRRAFLAASAAGLAAPSVAHATWPPWEAGHEDRRAVENGLRDAAVFSGEREQKRSVTEAMEAAGVPGLGFALIDKGRIAWEAGYGVTREGGPTVEGSTLFQAGSIAKPVAAVATLRMRDAGLLDIDRDAQAYFGDYRLPAGKQTAEHPVTLCGLISHTAGITPGGYAGYAQGVALPTNEQIVRGLDPANSPALEVVSEPGSTLAYSGGGYTLLQMAMQNVDRRPFDVLMHERVLRPFGTIRSTYALPLPPYGAARAATGHRFDGRAVEGGWFNHPEQAAAGLWSCPGDIARFMLEVRRAWLGKGVALPQQTARDFLTVQKDDEGLGIIVHGEGDTLSFRHGGSTRGFTAFMVMENVVQGRGAVYMTNSDNGQDVGVQLFRAASAAYGWRKFKPAVHRRARLEPAVLKGLAGTYSFAPGIDVRVAYEDRDNRIVLTFPNGDLYPMVPIGDRKFVHPRDNKIVEFQGEPGVEVMLVDDETGRRTAAA